MKALPAVGSTVTSLHLGTYLQRHVVIPGESRGIVVKHGADMADDPVVIVDWGNGKPVRYDADELKAVPADEPALSDRKILELYDVTFGEATNGMGSAAIRFARAIEQELGK